MKKVIILLALVLGIKVNAQIVGGFVPLNSTKTPTMAGIRVTGTTNKIGNTTLITSNTTTLTSGATSGTVAVLSDALFSITLSFPSSNPADGATSYFGSSTYPLSGNATFGRVRLPYNCTLVGWDLNIGVFGTIGSTESTTTLSIRANNTTDYTLSTTLAYSVATGYNPYSGNAVSIDFAANDYINAKHIFNTFATNPTNVYEGLTLWFVRRP